MLAISSRPLCVNLIPAAGCKVPVNWFYDDRFHVSNTSGPLFTKRTDVLRQDLAKSRSREIRV